MPRRHRRVSASSVESVDEARIRWRSDDSVLKKVHDSDSSENEWPTFEVKDAIVYNKDGKTLENALDVGSRGPFIVRGHLVIDRTDEEQRARLLAPTRGPTPIEAKACTRYSVGLSEDGDQPVIWVSGTAGWYEITPAPKYRPIYKDMCDAVLFYYRVQDAYNHIYPPNTRRGHKTKTKSIAQELAAVFLQYAITIGDGVLLHEVIERVARWEYFLVNQMSDEDPDAFAWKTTALHHVLSSKPKDLRKELEGIFETLDIQNSSPHEVLGSKSPMTMAPATANAPATRARSSSSVATGSPFPNANPSQTKRETSANLPLPPNESNTQRTVPALKQGSETRAASSQPLDEAALTPLQSVVVAVEWAFDKFVKSQRKDFRPQTCFSHLYFEFTFPTSTPYTTSIEDVIRYNAKGLTQTLNPAKYADHSFWGYLHEQADKPFVPERMNMSDFPYIVRSRKKMSKSRATETAQTVVPAPIIQTVDDDAGHGAGDDDDDTDSFITPRRGKAPKGPRPSQSGLRLARKRARNIISSDSDEESYPKRSQHCTEEDSVDEADTPTGNGNGLALAETPLKLVIRADKIPSIKPRGPDSTWQCDEDGCDFMVRGGDDEQLQERIQEHLQAHEEGASRINLALTESRGYMPVDHLLEKLKKSGKDKAPDLELNGVRLQRPINRRLLV